MSPRSLIQMAWVCSGNYPSKLWKKSWKSWKAARKLILGCPKGGIYKLIYFWYQEGILWSSFVQACKVHTHPPFPSLLLHYHDVGQPFQIENFFIGSSPFQLVYFLFNCIRVKIRGSTWVLFLWSAFRVHIEPMANELRIYPWGSIGTLSKNISITN